MKKLAVFLLLLTLTSTSYCQIATKTQHQSSDSLIVLPTRLVKYLIQDLIKGDDARKIVVQQDSLITEKNKQLTIKDSIVVLYQQQDTVLRATADEFARIESVHQRTIQSLQYKSNKYKRQRNVFGLFVGILLVSHLAR